MTVISWTAYRKQNAHPLANKLSRSSETPNSKQTQQQPKGDTPTPGGWLRGLFKKNKNPASPASADSKAKVDDQENGLASVEKMDYMLIFFKLQASAVKVKMSQRLRDFRPEDLKNIDDTKLYQTAIRRKLAFHKWADWLHSIYINAHVKQKWSGGQQPARMSVQRVLNNRTSPQQRPRLSALRSRYAVKSSKKREPPPKPPAL